MKIEHQTNLFIGDNSKNERSENANNRNKKTVFGGDLKQNLDPIAKKRKDAQEKAMKIVGDAFANEKKIDDDLEARKELINQLQGKIKETQLDIKKISDTKNKLMLSYGLTEDSQEEKDLKLLEKRLNSEAKPPTEALTDEERKKLIDIDKKGLTEYQNRALEMYKYSMSCSKKIVGWEKQILIEDAIIRGVKLERLKTHPLIDATKQADAIKKAANNEIIDMLVEESKDHVDEGMKEEEEELEEKKVEEKEKELEEIKVKEEKQKELANNDISMPTESILKLDQLKSDAQTKVENIVDNMKLVIEDIKGTVVDLKL